MLCFFFGRKMYLVLDLFFFFLVFVLDQLFDLHKQDIGTVFSLTLPGRPFILFFGKAKQNFINKNR